MGLAAPICAQSDNSPIKSKDPALARLDGFASELRSLSISIIATIDPLPHSSGSMASEKQARLDRTAGGFFRERHQRIHRPHKGAGVGGCRLKNKRAL